MSEKPSVFPVSEAMMLPVGALVQPLVDVLVAIDSVHSDGRLPPIIVQLASLPDDAGVYDFLPPNDITISTFAEHPRITFAHEIGQAVDHHGLSDGRILASADDPSLADWRQAVRASGAYQEIMALHQRFSRSAVGAHLAYALRAEEVWARSYAQFIATRCDNELLRQELDERRVRRPGMVYIPYQWDDNDFTLIEREIAKLFRLKGWMA